MQIKPGLHLALEVTFSGPGPPSIGTQFPHLGDGGLAHLALPCLGPAAGTMELETSQQKGDEAGTSCTRRGWPERDVYSSALALGLWNQIAWAQIQAVPLSAVGLQTGYWI